MNGWTWRRRGVTLVSVPYVEPRADVSLRACPVCGARLTQSCRSVNGVRRRPHPTRVVTRRCLCGAPVAAHRKLCDTCRDETRRTRPRGPHRNRARDERRRLARS